MRRKRGAKKKQGRCPSFNAHAQRPRRDISPAPRIMHPREYSSFGRGWRCTSGLNTNSCARSSTRPVYRRMPALTASKQPLTADAVVLLGLYVVLQSLCWCADYWIGLQVAYRTPIPIAMPKGVVNPYAIAPAYRAHEYDRGRSRNASRDPRPKPSNISVVETTPSASALQNKACRAHDGRRARRTRL